MRCESDLFLFHLLFLISVFFPVKLSGRSNF